MSKAAGGSFEGLGPGRVVLVTFYQGLGPEALVKRSRPATVVEANPETGVITANIHFNATTDVGRVKLPTNHLVYQAVETVPNIPHVGPNPDSSLWVWDWPPR